MQFDNKQAIIGLSRSIGTCDRQTKVIYCYIKYDVIVTLRSNYVMNDFVIGRLYKYSNPSTFMIGIEE